MGNGTYDKDCGFMSIQQTKVELNETLNILATPTASVTT